MIKRIIGTLVLLALVAGCGGETGVRLVIRKDAALAVPADLDSLRVTVFAGATGTERFHRTQPFGDLTEDSFPVTVGVTAGSSYDDWVMFRVEGLLGTDRVIERWVVAQFVDGEIREVVVELQDACLLRACDGGQECRDGACATAERPAGWTVDCGDAVPDTGEECDDGEANSDTLADACRTNCVAAACGDNVVDTGEQCDDGNTTSGDGCSAGCRTEGAVCGNGEIEGTEECDDGNATDNDGCQHDCTDTCHAAADCDDEDQCTRDTCDPAATGGGQVCRNVIDDGAACDDGNPCTTGETCNASGACTGGTTTCECDPAGTDTCEADHGDGDPCNGTLECNATGECVVDPATVLDAGHPCDNGIFCDGVDVCGGSPLVCQSPGNPCAACQTCDEAGDECDINSGSCFIDDACYGDGNPNPANVCQVCDADALATAWSNAPDTTPCDDGDPCTAGEVCTAGVCGGGTPSCECDPAADTCEADRGDGDPCNGRLHCDSVSRTCVVEPGTPLTEGASCDDGAACNGTDTCHDPGTGLVCTHAGSPCRSCETCVEGSPPTCTLNTGYCILGTPPGCVARGTPNPANECEICDDVESTTTWTPNAGAPCDDGEFCNGTDACETDGTCSRHTGAPPAGTPCTADADACTIDACSGGVCAHTAECVDSTVAVNTAATSWRFCVTDANCSAAVGAACTAVNVPASWNSWSTSGTPMTHCTAGGGFWVATVTGLTSGNQCYRFYGTDGTTPAWFSDPAAGADCGTGAGYCDPPTDTNCRVVVP